MTINEKYQEGLNENFVLTIEEDLSMFKESELSSSDLIKKVWINSIFKSGVSKSVKTKYERLDNILDKIILILKKKCLTTSILHKISSLLYLDEISLSKKELIILYKQTLSYFEKIKDINQSIKSDIATFQKADPNLFLAYDDLASGIYISITNCGKFLHQKVAISKRKSKINKFYTVTYPEVDFSIENDRKIIEESYRLIKRKKYNN